MVVTQYLLKGHKTSGGWANFTKTILGFSLRISKRGALRSGRGARNRGNLSAMTQGEIAPGCGKGKIKVKTNPICVGQSL